MTEIAVIGNAAPEAPEVPAEQVAEVATSNDRYPNAEVALEIGRRLRAAHEAGWTRPKVQALVALVRRTEGEGDQPDVYALSPLPNEGDGFTMTGSALWRTRDGRVHVNEVPYITCVLDAIDAGEVTLPERPTKDAGKLRASVSALQARLDAVQALAEGSTDVKGVGGLREVLAEIVAVASGQAEPASDDAPAAE